MFRADLLVGYFTVFCLHKGAVESRRMVIEPVPLVPLTIRVVVVDFSRRGAKASSIIAGSMALVAKASSFSECRLHEFV